MRADTCGVQPPCRAPRASPALNGRADSDSGGLRALTTSPDPVVRMRGIVKRFPGVLANAGVDFDLLPGEVHALLGENGAGKSTLMNVLYGLHTADEGEILLRGKRVAFRSAADAIDAGLGMVHQHFMLVKPFTVAENMVLGRPSPRAPLARRPPGHRKAAGRPLAAVRRCRSTPPRRSGPSRSASSSASRSSRRCIAGADVLILDEPTAVLTPQEWTGLLGIIQRLQAEGKSIVFISHKLGEVLAVSDRITVMRDGRVVGEARTQDDGQEHAGPDDGGPRRRADCGKGTGAPGRARAVCQGVSAENDRGLPALAERQPRGSSRRNPRHRRCGRQRANGAGRGYRGPAPGGERPHHLVRTDAAGQATGRAPSPGLAHVPSDRYGMAMLKDFSIAENLVLQNVGKPPFTCSRFPRPWRDSRQCVATRPRFRRADALHRGDGRQPVGRQCAEDGARARVVSQAESAAGCPTDTRAGCGRDRVRAPQAGRAAGCGRRGASDFDRTRRGPRPERPDRGHVRGRDHGRRGRRQRRHQRHRPDDGRAAPPSRGCARAARREPGIRPWRREETTHGRCESGKGPARAPAQPAMDGHDRRAAARRGGRPADRRTADSSGRREPDRGVRGHDAAAHSADSDRSKRRS